MSKSWLPLAHGMRLPALSSSPAPGSRSTRAGSGLPRAATAACSSSPTRPTWCRSPPPRCSAAGRRHGFRGALRGFWILIGLACASWLAGEVLWSVRELGTGSVPFPWWTDACYLGFYGFALVALVVFFRPSFRLAGSEAVLDGALAIASLALLWWWLVLRDVAVAADVPSLVGLSYPVLDLVLLCVVALDSARRGQAGHAGRLAGRVRRSPREESPTASTRGSCCRTSTRPACGSTSAGRSRRA